MSNQAVGIRDLLDVLTISPPRGRHCPELPISVLLLFSTVAGWEAAVEQYGATVKYANHAGDGHYRAVRQFAVDDSDPFAFAGAELDLAVATTSEDTE